MTVLDELRAEIHDGRPVSDAALLAGAARIIEQLDEQITGLQVEITSLRLELSRMRATEKEVRGVELAH